MIKKNFKVLMLLMMSFILISCSTAPITGRKQIKFISDAELAQQSSMQYEQFIGEVKSKNLLINNTNEGARLRRIGQRVAQAVERFLVENGMQENLANLKWEFNLIKSNEMNAFALPGGKIAFYSGILPVLKTDSAIAYVMGHEIGHVIGGHHAERQSGQSLAGVISTGTNILTGGRLTNVTNDVLGLTLLKFSRTQEYEADKYGMIFMAMAGYNPADAILAEERIMAQGKSATSEFLSTHPSGENRLEELKKYLPEAMKYYKK